MHRSPEHQVKVAFGILGVLGAPTRFESMRLGNAKRKRSFEFRYQLLSIAGIVHCCFLRLAFGPHQIPREPYLQDVLCSRSDWFVMSVRGLLQNHRSGK